MKKDVDVLVKLEISEKENYYFLSLTEADGCLQSKNLDLSQVKVSTCQGLKCEEDGQVYYYLLHFADELKKQREVTKNGSIDRITYTFHPALLTLEVGKCYLVHDAEYQREGSMGGYGPITHSIAEVDSERMPSRSVYDGDTFTFARILYVGKDTFQLSDIDKSTRVSLGDDVAILRAEADRTLRDKFRLFERKQAEFMALAGELNQLKQGMEEPAEQRRGLGNT